MNVTMKLTLDGLKRALRWKAHELAETADQGYRDDARADAVPRRETDRVREADDDRPGR
ncbi:hypothetical protein [Mesorhizobium sp. ANAO-SY3R2]|uniref:hypothetical protein n=1 Tax=Mesorhizobium sp. ANAO-SY3R2 TaxID=3166644 RepID=UPI0036732029